MRQSHDNSINGVKMRVAITGSTGRVGRAIYVHLSKYYDVVGLDRSPSSTADIVADLGDQAALERLLDGVDAVVHVAALHAPHVGNFADVEFERINIEATEKLLNICIKNRINRFVLTSTTALYGHAVNSSHGAAWLDESVIPLPKNIYHRTKLKSEELVQQAASIQSFSAIALRMSRCFPEPADLMTSYRLHRGVDARDVATAHRFVLESATAGFQKYIVSSATPFQKSDCEALGVDAIEVLKVRVPELVDEFKKRGWKLPVKIDRVYASNSLIDKGWIPKYGFEEVLHQYDDESSEILIPRR